MPVLRPCLDCGRLTRGTRCAEHVKARERRRGTPTQRGYDATWRRLRGSAIAYHPWCERCGATTDLTGDHIVPLVRGGMNSPDNIRVLCRSCNSRRGARLR